VHLPIITELIAQRLKTRQRLATEARNMMRSCQYFIGGLTMVEAVGATLNMGANYGSCCLAIARLVKVRKQTEYI
jgi:hypothetical protein